MNLKQAKESVKDVQNRMVAASIMKNVRLGIISPNMARSFMKSQGIPEDVIQDFGKVR